MRRQTIILLALIFVLALGLRLWGIDNGLPHGQIPDESADITTSLRIAAGENPTYAFHRVGWPLSQLPLHALHFAYLRFTEPDFGTEAFEARYFTHRGDFVLSIRLLLATLAALTILPAYVIGRELTTQRAGGFAAALLLAIHPVYTYLSHVALPDGYALTWVTITLLGAVYIARTGKRWAYLLAGAGVALTLLARVQIVVIALPVLLAHLLRWYDGSRSARFLLLRGVWALLGCVIALLIFNPFIVIAPGDVLDDLRFIFDERYSGTVEGETLFADDPGRAESIAENLDLPFVMMRPYFALLALGGLMRAGYRRDFVTLATVGAFWVIFSLSLLPAVRPRVTFWLPAIIPTVILIGYLAASIFDRQRWAIPLGILLAGCFFWGLAETIQINRALERENTRLLAYNFVIDTIPENSRILIGDPFIYSAPLSRSAQSMERMQTFTELPPSYEHFLEHPEDAPRPQYDLFGNEYRAELTSAWREFIDENAIEYVIEADYCNPDDPLEATMPEESLREELELLYVASPFDSSDCETRIENRTHMEYMQLGKWQRAGPIIRIHAVR